MKYSLSDICFFSRDKVNVAQLTTKTYISTENMLPNRAGVETATALPMVEQVQAFQPGDVLVSNIRPYFRKIWTAKNKGGCSNDVLVFRAKEGTCSDFLYYVLSDDKFFNFATATSKGTKMPRGDKAAIMQYQVPHYPIETQEKIAQCLRVIDDKINVNSAINHNLQQQAQALYHRIFCASSRSNWQKGVLSDIATVIMGQSPSGKSYNESGVGAVFYQGRAEFGSRFPTQRLYTTEPKRMAKEHDILISVRAPVGDLNVAKEDCCIGRGLGAIRSKDGHQSFVLYTMFALQPQLEVFNGEGTVFGSISRDSLNSIPIIIPPIAEIDKFEALVAPMDSAIRANYDEICRLQAIRDGLLPKLMSGEIDVSEVEI